MLNKLPDWAGEPHCPLKGIVSIWMLGPCQTPAITCWTPSRIRTWIGDGAPAAFFAIRTAFLVYVACSCVTVATPAANKSTGTYPRKTCDSSAVSNVHIGTIPLRVTSPSPCKPANVPEFQWSGRGLRKPNQKGLSALPIVLLAFLGSLTHPEIYNTRKT